MEVGPSQQDLDKFTAASQARQGRVNTLIAERDTIGHSLNTAALLGNSTKKYEARYARLQKRIKRIDRRVNNPLKLLYRKVEAAGRAEEARAANRFGIAKSAAIGSGILGSLLAKTPQVPAAQRFSKRDRITPDMVKAFNQQARTALG